MAAKLNNKGAVYKREIRTIILHNGPGEHHTRSNYRSEKIIVEDEDRYFRSGSYYEDKTFRLNQSHKIVANSKSLHIMSSENKDEYSCEVCAIVCTGIDNFRLHIEGKKHAKKLKELKILKQMRPISENLSGTPLKKCDICEKKFSSQSAFLQHSKCEALHASSLHDLVKTMTFKDPVKLLKVTSSSNSPFITCEDCKKWFGSSVSYEQHTDTGEHSRQVHDRQVERTVTCSGNDPPRKVQDRQVERTVISSGNVPQLKCETCGKSFNGSVPFKQHLLSDSHFKKEGRAKVLMRANLIQSSGLFCKCCCMKFSGVVPFHQHVRGTSHQKTMKKMNLMKNLEEEHPEVLDYSMFGIRGENVKGVEDGKLERANWQADIKKSDAQVNKSGVVNRDVVKERVEVKKLQDLLECQNPLVERNTSGNESSDEPLIEL